MKHKIILTGLFVLIISFFVVITRNILSLISSYAEHISVDLRLFNWDGVAGISNALMVILNLVLVLGIFLSYFNLRENTKSRVCGILFRANEYIDEVKKDIAVIRARATDVPEWRDDDKESIAKAAAPIPDEEANKVSKVLQRLSYLVRAGFIPEKHLIEMWGPLFLEMWLLLEPWVKNKRVKNGEPTQLKKGAFSRKDFEWFAARCCKNPKIHISLHLEEKYSKRIDQLKTLR